MQSLWLESYSKASDTLCLYVESLTGSLKHNQCLPYRPVVSQSLLWDLHRIKTINQIINLSVTTKLMACSFAVNPLIGKDCLVLPVYGIRMESVIKGKRLIFLYISDITGLSNSCYYLLLKCASLSHLSTLTLTTNSCYRAPRRQNHEVWSFELELPYKILTSVLTRVLTSASRQRIPALPKRAQLTFCSRSFLVLVLLHFVYASTKATICSTLPYSVLCIKCSQLLARGLHLPSHMHHSKLISYLRGNVNAAIPGLMGN